jgi:hypothetical protein
MEHGGEYPDSMPQAIVATDAEGRSSTYVPVKLEGRVVDSKGFELTPDEPATDWKEPGDEEFGSERQEPEVEDETRGVRVDPLPSPDPRISRLIGPAAQPRPAELSRTQPIAQARPECPGHLRPHGDYLGFELGDAGAQSAPFLSVSSRPLAESPPFGPEVRQRLVGSGIRGGQLLAKRRDVVL